MPDKRIFTLEEARRLLPEVKRFTAEAAASARQLAERLDDLEEGHPQRQRVEAELTRTVMEWAGRMSELSLEVKGLWLVDFDNGAGYYCWQYPEPGLDHYHGYDESFAGRVKIM